jgi:diguanylate cyclase (GGDEF)-like protein/PAS domain S-box-containing protein
VRNVSPRILLIESDRRADKTIRDALAGAVGEVFVLEAVHGLSAGLERLRKKNISAVLLDLSLPDSRGIETFERLFSSAPEIPIVILGQGTDETIAMEAVARGAQDYITQRHLDSDLLPHVLRNAITRKALQESTSNDNEEASISLNSIGEGVLCTDTSGRITYLNAVSESLIGWEREEARGRPFEEVFCIVDGTTREIARNPLKMAMEQNRSMGLMANCTLIGRAGGESAIEHCVSPIHDRNGRVLGAVMVFHGLSAEKSTALEITYSAHHDPLTNLPNRLLLNDRISRSIALAHRQNRPIAVIFLDLDHFKHINDSLGHSVGDKLLQSIAKRLVGSLRSSDTVSRQGGDEFVVLLSDVFNRDDAARSAKRILASLKAPHFIENRTLYMNGSIGISIYPDDGETAETLIHNADTAMYYAKETGRNAFHFFTSTMNQKAVERQSLESSLRDAIEREEFLLEFQPKVNLNTGKFTGCEALLRWNRPGFGMIPPGRFISVAEECGLIVQIGQWVLREACRQARAWQQAGIPALPIAVNVSAVEFREGSFIGSLQRILTETGLEPRYLELELTEGVLMKDVEHTGHTLKRLKKMGVQLAVDDFGAGYSSLSDLRQFPFDSLKIDRSFIQQITSNPNDSLLIASIIHMGKSLRHRVVAEGIETQQQMIYLQSNQCGEGQGFLFSRPLGALQFAGLLEADFKQATYLSSRSNGSGAVNSA